MASLSCIDEAYEGESGHFVQHHLPDLIASLLEPKKASFRKIERFVQLLLLSNHTDQAYILIAALQQHHDAISPPSPNERHDGFGSRMRSRAFAEFWNAHPAYAPPGETSVQSEDPDKASARRRSSEISHWHEYRECTRTGWMLEHCNLPEPEDPHTWRETDDAPMIAMCARLLAKDKTPGQYPDREAMKEALAAAKKLYAQPQVPVTEWDFKYNRSKTVRRHSYLLYRRLVVELAIRVGELETAAEVLSLGLRLDGFNSSDGGQLDRYLYVPGIYSVLPIMAKRKKEGNPFFIERYDAAAMVKEITAALELRAREGRQWSLAPEKVGWKELLNRLAKGAWAVNRKEYEEQGLTCAEDILHSPATEEEIAEAEAKVGELPADFKEMVRIANGFEGGWHFLNGGIAGVEEIGPGADEYTDMSPLGDLDEDVGSKIIVLWPAVECDGFKHFMISPAHWRCGNGCQSFKDGEYPYWNSAYWQCSDHVYNGFRDWVAGEVERIEAMVKRGQTEDDDE